MSHTEKKNFGYQHALRSADPNDQALQSGGNVSEERAREVENPAEALCNEDGIFRVTSPSGHVFQVTCRRGRNMRIREIGNVENSASEVAHNDRFEGMGYEPSPQRWHVQKIA